jgi:formyltetrahydrofolate deformylase
MSSNLKDPTVKNRFLLALSCPDRPGLVSSVAALLFEAEGNIVDAQQFNDPETGRFFTRIVFDTDGDIHGFCIRFSAHAKAMGMAWRLRPIHQLQKVLLLVSKFDHCLVDLIYRMNIGELNMELVGIVSNHPREGLNLPDPGSVPYHHFPVMTDTKHEQEARIRELVADTSADLVVLARYMQILSNDMARFLEGRCINIHHSFLPGFKGAKPYHQAHARGVKMIGATAHYVTGDLDEGPIICQDVEHIGHGDTPDDLIRKGRDIERRVLARAVHYHLEERVFLNGSKTVVFRD